MPKQNTKRSNSRASEKHPTRVFSFGCKRPSQEHEEWLRNQVWKANDVKNAMVQNEMATRRERESILCRYIPEYQAAIERANELSRQINDLYEKLQKQRQKTRTRCRVPEIEDRIKALKDERSVAYTEAKAAKKPFEKTLKPFWDAYTEDKDTLLGDACFPESKDLRKTPGPRTKGMAHRQAVQDMEAMEGTPQAWIDLVRLADRSNQALCVIRNKGWLPTLENNAPDWLRERTRKAWESPLDKDTKEMAHEAFKSAVKKTAEEGGQMQLSRGTIGRVGVIWDKHTFPQVLEGGFVASRKFSLTDPGPEDIGTDKREPTSKRSKRHRRMVAEFLIAGTKVKLRVLVHRQLPVGASIKRAWVMIRKDGSYDLQLVVQSDSFRRAPAKRLAAVAIKPTWRTVESGENAATEGAIIVGEWLGSDGSSGVIELEARTNQALTIVDRLRQFQDDHHNEARSVVLDWLAQQPKESEPELREAMTNAKNWRSPKHLARVAIDFRDQIPNREELWDEWKRACFEQKKDLFMPFPTLCDWLSQGADHSRFETESGKPAKLALLIYLEWWRRKNKHLHTYESRMRTTALRKRREEYRVKSAMLSSRYDRLFICAVDLKKAARKTLPEHQVKGPEDIWTGQRRRAAPSELVNAMANAFGTTPKKAKGPWKTLEEALKKEVPGAIQKPSASQDKPNSPPPKQQPKASSLPKQSFASKGEFGRV